MSLQPQPNAPPPQRPDAVPRRRWAETCADFSRQHRGWLVQLWAVPTAVADAGAEAVAAAGQALAVGVPLHDVTVDASAAMTAIVLHTAAPPGSGQPVQQLRIAAPAALSLERAADGTVTGLRIDDTAGHSTLLHFRTTEPPEMLDGLADTER